MFPSKMVQTYDFKKLINGDKELRNIQKYFSCKITSKLNNNKKNP